MTTPLRHVARDGSGAGAPASILELPPQWRARSVPDGVVAIYSDDRTLDVSIETNIVVTSRLLPVGESLGSWQSSIRSERLAALPDLQILDERSTASATGDDLWYSSSVMTDARDTTLLTRRWCRIAQGRGFTLTLTTLPLVDVLHGELLDRIADTWRIDADLGEEAARALA